MSEMEEKIGAILNNPQMMSSILSMAQSLDQNSSPPPKEAPQTNMNVQDFDFSLLQKLSGMAGQSQIDSQQKELLKALRPYLNHQRVAKLEKAMRAAKMAKLATAFLNSGGLQLLSGR